MQQINHFWEDGEVPTTDGRWKREEGNISKVEARSKTEDGR